MPNKHHNAKIANDLENIDAAISTPSRDMRLPLGDREYLENIDAVISTPGRDIRLPRGSFSSCKRNSSEGRTTMPWDSSPRYGVEWFVIRNTMTAVARGWTY